MREVITLFGLGRAFHVVHGSYMANDSPVGLLSIMIVIFNFLLTCACSILTIASVNKIAHYTNTEPDHRPAISWAANINTYFYVLPQGLGFMGIVNLKLVDKSINTFSRLTKYNLPGVPQLWSCLYFGICILVNLNQQITHLIMIEKSLSDIFPNLSRYRKYVLSFFCIFSCIVSCLFLSRVQLNKSNNIIIIDKHFCRKLF